MVELIVALSVLVVGFLGIVELLSKSIVTNRNIADQYTASYLAGEGVEIVKNLIDANIAQGDVWNCSFSTGVFNFRTPEYGTEPPGGSCPGNALLPAGGSPIALNYDSATHLYGGSGTASPFTRTIGIVVAGDTIYVSSTVTYGGNKVVVEDIFTNWRP